MRPLSETLTELIGFAEEVITSPGKFYGMSIDERFSKLSAEMHYAHALPAEAERTSRAGMIMVLELEGFFASDRESTSSWLMHAGGILPELRGEAWKAKQNEKEARGS